MSCFTLSLAVLGETSRHLCAFSSTVRDSGHGAGVLSQISVFIVEFPPGAGVERQSCCSTRSGLSSWGVLWGLVGVVLGTLKKIFFLIGTQTSISCSTCWCFHRLIFVYAPTRHRTNNLGVLGRCSSPPELPGES